MSDELDKVFTAALLELKNDVKQLDGKFDLMHEVLIKNSVVLTEHERRSTASEARLTIVEDKVNETEKGRERIKGFLLIAGAIIATLGSVAGIVELFLKK
jgi:hypothetical protein